MQGLYKDRDALCSDLEEALGGCGWRNVVACCLLPALRLPGCSPTALQDAVEHRRVSLNVTYRCLVASTIIYDTIELFIRYQQHIPNTVALCSQRPGPSPTMYPLAIALTSLIGLATSAPAPVAAPQDAGESGPDFQILTCQAQSIKVKTDWNTAFVVSLRCQFVHGLGGTHTGFLAIAVACGQEY
jgi:hypothetical protein